MMALQLRTARDAEDFSAAQWSHWDAMLSASGEPSIHLSSQVVRASLRSPSRAVCAGVWTNTEERVVGIAVLEDSQAISQGIDDFLEGSALFGCAKTWLHRDGGLRFNVRVIGTPLASGPHGYRFAPGVDDWSCLRDFLNLPSASNKSPKTWIVKDRASVHTWGNGHRHAGRSSWRREWTDLEFDPVMRVNIQGKKSWEDYLAGMRTKARTKVKRVMKLSESIEFESLSVDSIRRGSGRLHELYMQVYGRAAFRLGCLQTEDLPLLKEELGERFQVWVAKLGGEVIGFHCGMCDKHEVEAYFVGFEGGHNKSHALYQRMLVEFIQWGIREGCDSINLGRTALDIKASLGAEPHRLVLHERMQNPILHMLSKWAARASAPKQPVLKRAWKEDLPSGNPASPLTQKIPLETKANA